MVKRGIPKKHLRKAFSIVASESIEFTWFKTYTNNWFSIDEKKTQYITLGEWLVQQQKNRRTTNLFVLK